MVTRAKRRSRGRNSIGNGAFGLAGVAVLSLLAVAPAIAAGTEMTVTVTGGALTLPRVEAVAPFAQTTLSGRPAWTTDLRFTVADWRGTGAGWEVTAAADGVTGAGDAASGRSLPAGSLVVTAPAVTPRDGANAGPTATGGLLDGGVQVVAAAAPGQGMGEFSFDGTLTLAAPSGDGAGDVGGTVTLTLAPAVSILPAGPDS